MNFPPTRLSVVERTRSDDEETRRVAFGTLIEAYWKPVYKYLRLKWSLDPDEAADLTQEFFTTTLEKDVSDATIPNARGSAPTCDCVSMALRRTPERRSVA